MPKQLTSAWQQPSASKWRKFTQTMEFLQRKVFGARFSRFPKTEVIQVESRLLQCKGPKARLDDLWSSMLRVDQHSSCLLCELFNICLCNSVLKMRSNSAIADCLIVIWHVALETFLCKNSIVCVNFLHFDAEGCCHALVSCFGIYGFDEGMAALQVSVHLWSCMVDKNCRRPETIGG